jgi:hypothetical protein
MCSIAPPGSFFTVQVPSAVAPTSAASAVLAERGEAALGWGKAGAEVSASEQKSVVETQRFILAQRTAAARDI